MKMPWQHATWESTIRSNVALSISVLIMSCISAFAVVYALTQHERIVITPAMVDKTMSVNWNSADEEYVKAFALSIAQMLGNLTPENTPFVADSMSMFMDSGIYTDMRKSILATGTSRQFKELSQASKFVSNGVLFEPKTNLTFVTGVLEVITATGRDKRSQVYEMDIRVTGGRPMIYQFNWYEGAPHTKEWVAKHAGDEKTGETK